MPMMRLPLYFHYFGSPETRQIPRCPPYTAPADANSNVAAAAATAAVLGSSGGGFAAAARVSLVHRYTLELASAGAV